MTTDIGLSFKSMYLNKENKLLKKIISHKVLGQPANK